MMHVGYPAMSPVKNKSESERALKKILYIHNYCKVHNL